MAGNGLPSLGRVKLTDLAPTEGLPSDSYKQSVSTLSQSLALYSAAIIQFPVSDGALLRSGLDSARLYFHQKGSYPAADMVNNNDPRDWCKTSGYNADPQLWLDTYDYRPGLTSLARQHNGISSSRFTRYIFTACKGSSRYIGRYQLLFELEELNEVLDNVPLRNREISSSVLSVCCHVRPSFQGTQHHSLTAQEDDQLVMFSDHEHQVDKSLISLVKLDKAGLHIKDFQGR